LGVSEKVKSLFFRLYLLLALAFVGLGWSIDQLLDHQEQQEDLTTDLELHKGTLFMLNQRLTRQPIEERDTLLSGLRPSFGFPLTLTSIEQLSSTPELQSQPPSQQQISHLEQGGIIALFDDFSGQSWFLQKLLDSQQVMLIGPIQQSGTNTGILYAFIFLLGLGLIVFLLVWPISKDLVSLTRSASAFGAGDFSVRSASKRASPLAELVNRFNSMADRIQRLLKSHKELSHAVSHELRTPIARIRFAMEIIREVEDKATIHHYLSTMDENIEELDKMVDELLTYAKFDREEPPLQLQQVNLPEKIEKILNRFRQPFSHLQFQLHQHEDSLNHCQCDPAAIERTLDNLIRNAVRYAKTQIRIDLKIDNLVTINIEDDGSGIPESDWQTVFDPFVRLDKSRDRNSGGVGLGLAIVKRYIELHRGSICVGTGQLGGARFNLSWRTGSTDRLKNSHS
jgi:signal transduction histidine kinase